MEAINFQNYKSGGLLKFMIGGTVIFGALSMALHHLLELLPDGVKWLILFTDALTVPTFFIITFSQIEKKWWRYKFFHFLIDCPDMNGRYKGNLVSSFEVDGKQKIMLCVIEILQTATRIKIFGYFNDPDDPERNSSSESSLEKIIKKENGFFKVYYNFSNVNGTLEDLLKGHIGTASFDYFSDIEELRGDYFNVKGNTGKIVVKKESITRLGRF